MPITTSNSNVVWEHLSSLGNFLYSPSAPIVKISPNKRSIASETSNANEVADFDKKKYPINPYDILVSLTMVIHGIAVMVIMIARLRHK